MAIKVRQRGKTTSIAESVDGPGEATLSYWAHGSQDIDKIEAAILTAAPDSYRGLLVDNYEIDSSSDQDWDWFGNINYTQRKVEVGGYRMSFDTSGGDVHITQSFATTKYAKSGETAPDFKGAIAVRDGRAEGTDVVIPALQISITATIAAQYTTNAYIDALAELTGRYNEAAFLGRPAGEWLFLGAQGDIEVGKNWQGTFNYAVSRNVTGLTVGDITDIKKKGHDYLWVLYQDEVDATAKKLTSRPKAVYVEEVAEAGDFELFKIGVT